MTASAAADRLVAAGLDQTEWTAKAALYERAVACCRAVSGRDPSDAWWVPGRLEVFGKHTDYGGGRSLVAALPRGFIFAAAPRDDDRLVVIDATRETPVDLSDPLARDVPGTRHVHAAASRLARNFPGAHPGTTIVFVSDLPRSSGMSSSSALTIGVAVALIARWRCEARDEWRQQIARDEDLAVYCGCMESGRTFGALDGGDGVGTLGGSEDHAAILLARAAHVSAFEFAPMRRLADVLVPAEWRFVIATSGVAASKSGARRGDYNRLSRGVAELLRRWNASEPHSDSLAQALASSDAAGDRLRVLVQRSAGDGWSADELERRLAHFEIENVVVDEAIAAIGDADARRLGEIALASQERAELLLGNQTPETAALARAARDTGAFAATSFGAGFGGAVWALVYAGDADAFAARWVARYRQESDSGARTIAFPARPSPPLVHLG